MSLKFWPRKKLIWLTILALPIWAAWFLFFSSFGFNIYEDQQNQLTLRPPVETVEIQPNSGNSNVPIRLKIPAIKVDAFVEQVGLTSQGALAVPKGRGDAAWFKLGTKPGEAGAAVIVGHYGRLRNGQGSVFDNLHKLRSGDEIFVEDDGGVDIVFAVRESRRYNPKADTMMIFTAADDRAHLNLITCDGVWDKVAESYSQRLVVFADLASSTIVPDE